MTTLAEWHELYPDAVRDTRVFEAFIAAGLEPPRQEVVDSIGYSGAQQKVLSALVRKISDQFEEDA